MKNILINEAYIGTLVCHKTKKSTIYGYKTFLPKEEHFKHENFYPPIVSLEHWNRVQAIFESRELGKTSSGSITNQKKNLFAGLIKCSECQAVFVGVKRQTNGIKYMEYVCNNYHRYGKKYCVSHRVRESDLLDALFKELKKLLKRSAANIEVLDVLEQNWQVKKNYENSLEKQLKKKIAAAQDTVKSLILQMAKSPEREVYYNELILDQEKELENLKTRLQSQKKISKPMSKNLKKSILDFNVIIQEVLEKKDISVETLNLLVDKVYVSEAEKRIEIKFVLKAPYSAQNELYEGVCIPMKRQKAEGENFSISVNAL